MTAPTGYTEIAQNLFRGPRPTPDVLGAFVPSLKTVICLEKTVDPAELTAIGKLNLALHHIPMSEILPPAFADLQTAAAIMNDAALRPTVVSCRQGRDRTGEVAALWRVKYQGWSVNAAMNEMYAMHYHQLRYKLLGWVRQLESELQQAAR